MARGSPALNADRNAGMSCSSSSSSSPRRAFSFAESFMQLRSRSLIAPMALRFGYGRETD
jgi:hypothetical protein